MASPTDTACSQPEGRPAPLGQAVYPAQEGRGADLCFDLRELSSFGCDDQIAG